MRVVADQAESDDTESTQNDGDWLALGVYSVLSSSGEPTSRLMQLAANRQGELRGVYYDSISNNSQNLSGRIDQATQVAQWSIDSNSQVSFSATLAQLTQPTGTIQVDQPGGKQQWRVARQEARINARRSRHIGYRRRVRFRTAARSPNNSVAETAIDFGRVTQVELLSERCSVPTEVKALASS